MNIKDLIAEVRASKDNVVNQRGDFEPWCWPIVEGIAGDAVLLAAEVERLDARLQEVEQERDDANDAHADLSATMRETLFAGPLVTGRTADSLRVRDRLLGWVFTSFAAELEKSTAPNNLSISMTPDEDHTYAGYRLDLTIARPGHVSTHEQNDALRADVERLTTALADAIELGASRHIATSDAAAMKAARASFDLIINTVSADLDMAQYLRLLRANGVLANVGLPNEPYSVPPFALIGGNKVLTGSNIGGIAETQEMLDFCAEHGLGSTIELLDASDPAAVDAAWDRVVAGDVCYRAVMDTATIPQV